MLRNLESCTCCMRKQNGAAERPDYLHAAHSPTMTHSFIMTHPFTIAY